MNSARICVQDGILGPDLVRVSSNLTRSGWIRSGSTSNARDQSLRSITYLGSGYLLLGNEPRPCLHWLIDNNPLKWHFGMRSVILVLQLFSSCDAFGR
jgi:hypothetical protein